MSTIQLDIPYHVDKYLIPKFALNEDIYSREQKQQSSKALEKLILHLTSEIEGNVKGNKLIYKEIFQAQENQSLQKWFNDADIHMKKVEDHLVAQKVLISEDFANLQCSFSDMCQQLKGEMYLRLDQFQQQYKQSFLNLKDQMDENFELSTDFKYFSNCNILGAKLQSQNAKAQQDFIQRLRGSIERAKVMNNNRQNFLQSFRKMTSTLNKLTDNLPHFRLSENFDDLMKSVKRDCESYFSKNLLLFVENEKVKDEVVDLQSQRDLTSPKGKELAVRDQFPQMKQYQIVSDNKNLLQTIQGNYASGLSFSNLRPQKKYQMDIPITAVTALSDIHLALANSSDTRLRIFELQQKKIQTIQAHKEPITFLTKIITEDKYMNKDQIFEQSAATTKSSKKALLVSCSQDNSICLWNYDYEMKVQPSNYQKLLGFSNPPVYVMDLQDQQCIISGDSKGEITIWDYHKSKIIYACQGKHSDKIVSINLLKKYEKFLVASQDNVITVWKMKYNSNQQPDQIFCESVFQENFGGIQSINLSLKEPTFVFVGNAQGCVKLFNLDKKKVIEENNFNTQNSIQDLALIETSFTNSTTFNLISIGNNDKFLRMWKVNQNHQNPDELEFSTHKFDMNLNNNDTLSKSKFQIIKGNQPKFVIANEKMKEINVYEIIQ